jgi:hypothetical protein
MSVSQVVGAKLNLFLEHASRAESASLSWLTDQPNKVGCLG